MRVILRESARAHESVHDAAPLVAVDGAELEQTHRQIPVRAHAVAIDQQCTGAVHRLHRVVGGLLTFPLGDLEGEHIVLVVIPVPARLPHISLVDVRCTDLHVAAIVQVGREPLHEFVEHAGALRVIEHQSAAGELVEVEQVELLAEFAVVALLGLLEPREVRVEILLREPRGAVDALQHRTVGVAPPVRAGDLHELERLHPPAVRKVRAAAQVRERARRVCGDLGVIGEFTDELELVRLIGEDLLGLGTREHAAVERLLRGDDVAHLGLDGLEVLGCERAADLEVVVEAVLDRGTDAEVGAREQFENRLRHHVRGRVAEQVDGLGVTLGHDRHLCAIGHHRGQVDHPPIDAAGDRRGGETRADSGCHIGDGRTLEHGLDAAVRQRDRDLRHRDVPSQKTESLVRPQRVTAWSCSTGRPANPA